jgi:hypothetical protein
VPSNVDKDALYLQPLLLAIRAKKASSEENPDNHLVCGVTVSAGITGDQQGQRRKTTMDATFPVL